MGTDHSIPRVLSRLVSVLLATALLIPPIARGDEPARLEWKAADLRDRIAGGLLGQVLGNLNGLPYEFKYRDEPGDLPAYTPDLSAGARTDDDTDIEWVHIHAMERTGVLYLPPSQIAELWKRHINDHIWSANHYARQLMDLGLLPPATGNATLNPWSHFNLAGQFATETYALACPAQPETAARLAVHYGGVSVAQEPLQAGQLFATMIAQAFVEPSVDRLLDQGLQAVDPSSNVVTIVAFVRDQHRLRPHDWKAARQALRDRFTVPGSVTVNQNGYALNAGAVVAALLYGEGDFVQTLRLAFALGWDADCNAATCGTILGVIHGRAWFDRQGWTFQDAYRNTTRPGMPEDETLSSYARRIEAVARLVITENGGTIRDEPAGWVASISPQRPANIRPLAIPDQREDPVLSALAAEIGPGLDASEARTQARAAYLAIALDQAPRWQDKDPAAWSRAVAAINAVAPGLAPALARSTGPAAHRLQQAAPAAGLRLPNPGR